MQEIQGTAARKFAKCKNKLINKAAQHALSKSRQVLRAAAVLTMFMGLSLAYCSRVVPMITWTWP
jgi:hypothetical protein